MSIKRLTTEKSTQTFCESDMSNIEKLNDDCLLKILEYLPIVDRIRSEAVSKKWKSLIKKSWFSVKSWTFEDEFVWGYYVEDFSKFDDVVFNSLLNRFGKYLVKIDLSRNNDSYPLRMTPESIRNVCQSCPRLRTLHLGDMFQNVDILDCDVKKASVDECTCDSRISQIIEIIEDWKLISSLKKFGLIAYHVNLNSLSALISKMKSLESLFIEFSFYREYEHPSICSWPFSTLNEIIFQTCYGVTEDFLADIIRRVENLHTLMLEDLLNYNILYQLSPTQRKTLKNVSFSLVCDEHVNPNCDVRVFESFINLQRLKLCYTSITDVFFEKLVQNCKKIFFLDISDNYNITDNGIKHIVSLPKLRVLIMESILDITGKTLNKIANLEVLNCNGCENLEDEGMCAVIRQSKLRLVEIRECKKISNQFLKAAIAELSIRNEKEDITLVTNNSNINVQEIEKMPPQLIIDDSPGYFIRDMYMPFKCFPERIGL